MSIKEENKAIITLGAQLIKKGRVISVMTETVYGLLADAENSKAVEKIYDLKERPKINPLIVHVDTIEMAKNYAIFSEDALKIARKFWPGPLTLVLKRKKKCSISSTVTAGLSTIAIRIPDSKVFLNIINQSKKPIAAPSANRSGYVSSTNASHVHNSFGDKLSLIVDSGQSRIGLESTVLDLTNKPYKILRKGIYDKDIISRNSNVKIFDNNKRFNVEKPKSPGLLQKHYSPNTPLRLNVKKPMKNEVFLSFGNQYKINNNFNLSESADLNEAAYNLFDFLIKSDQLKKKRIAIAPIPNSGIGIVINERLLRAKGN